MNREFLTINDVYKGFGEGDNRVEILKGVNLNLTNGEFVMMLGPSGSGKSTILHLIAGLTPVDRGQIEVCGVNVQKCSTNKILELRRRTIGYVFQDFRLLQGLTALENVMVPLYAVGRSRNVAKKRAEELLELMELSHRMHHSPRKLSGGEQQRVGIARALANEPKIILADEPTGNLDQRLSDGIIKMLSTLPQKMEVSILMVTHNQQLTKYATRIVGLTDGQIEVQSNV